MKSITSIVQHLIKEFPYIEEALKRNLINHSSLARDLKDDIEAILGKEVNTSAIIMAIKRTAKNMDVSTENLEHNVLNKLGDISIRSGLCSLTYKKHEALDNLVAFIHRQDSSQQYYSYSMDKDEMTVITSNELAKDIAEKFSELRPTHTSNLGAVTISLPDDNTDTKGIYYILFKKLAWKGINIREIVSTSNYLTIVVTDDELNKVYDGIHSLKTLDIEHFHLP